MKILKKQVRNSKFIYAVISGGVPVGGFISPTDDSDQYPVIDPVWGIDGHRSVDSIATRDAIPTLRRREGMTCFVQDDQLTYQLQGGISNSNWTEFGGGFSGTGIYTESVVVGDAQGDVTITHDLGTRDLHISTFLLPNYDQVELDVRMDSDDTVIVNGAGDSQSVFVVIGTGGDGVGSNPYTAITGTYSEIKLLADTSGLIGGSFYKITDYQTIVEAGNDTSFQKYIYTNSTIEPLIIRASTPSTFYGDAISDLYPKEIIKYDFSKSSITKDATGGWDEGSGDWGDTINVSNVLSTSFEVNTELLESDNFYIYIEDDNNSYEYHYGDIGTKFTLTDIGGGKWKVDLIDTANDPINLIGSGSGYVEIEADIELSPIKGVITYRENVEKSIKTSFDFRGMRRLKYKLDQTSVPTYDSATTYNYKDLVIYNDILYKCIAETITNKTPQQSSKHWATVMDKISSNYFLSPGFTNIVNVNLIIDSSSSKLLPTFCNYNYSTETETFSLDSVEAIDIKSEDVVIIAEHAYTSQKNIIVESGCDSILIGSNIDGFTAIGGSRNVTNGVNSAIRGNSIFGKLVNTIFYGNIDNNTFYGAQDCTFANIQRSVFNNGLNRCSFNSSNSCTVGSTCTDLRIGKMSSTDIKNYCNNSYLQYSEGNTIEYGMNYVYSYSNNFKNNLFGKKWSYTTIDNGATVEDNIFGYGFGGGIEAHRLNIAFKIQQSTFAKNCLTNGNDSISFRIYRSTFGDNVFGLTATRIDNSYFGNNCYNINSSNIISRVIFDSYCNDFTCDNITSCSFGIGCQNINSVGGSLSYNDFSFGIESLTLGTGAGASELRSSTSCDVVLNSSNAIRVKYLNSSDIQVVQDPSI